MLLVAVLRVLCCAIVRGCSIPSVQDADFSETLRRDAMMSERYRLAMAVGLTVTVAGIASSVLVMLLLKERRNHDNAV